MEIGKVDVGAWLTLRPVDERIGELRLKIRPVPEDFDFSGDGDTKKQLQTIGSLIVDWNLEKDGVAIPCNDETRRLYMFHLIQVMVRGEGDEQESIVGPISRFAADITNFLGN